VKNDPFFDSREFSRDFSSDLEEPPLKQPKLSLEVMERIRRNKEKALAIRAQKTGISQNSTISKAVPNLSSNPKSDPISIPSLSGVNGEKKIGVGCEKITLPGRPLDHRIWKNKVNGTFRKQFGVYPRNRSLHQ
jgi:hypothetical protein